MQDIPIRSVQLARVPISRPQQVHWNTAQAVLVAFMGW